MSRTLATRLAIAESRAWLRSFQQAIEQSFLEAADEAGVSLATREGVFAALQEAYRAYPTPRQGGRTTTRRPVWWRRSTPNRPAPFSTRT
jgi:hypothetical protein